MLPLQAGFQLVLVTGATRAKCARHQDLRGLYATAAATTAVILVVVVVVLVAVLIIDDGC